MHLLPRQLVACMLAAIYALVGMTGQSLHYWIVETEIAEGNRADGHDRQGYFHRHGDDIHWHYHRAAGPGESRPEQADAPTAESGVAIHSAVAGHQAHSCSLIAIVAAMKLGLGGGGCSLFGPGDHGSFDGRCVEQVVETFGRTNFARGPPLPLSPLA